MKKFLLFFNIELLVVLFLFGCSKSNIYKSKMAEWFNDSKNQSQILENDGVCDILFGLIDKNNNVVSNDILEITDGEFLYDVLKRNDDKFKLQGSDSDYGFFMTGINDVVADYSKDGSYISLWINGNYAQYGISGLSLNDNDVVAAVYMIGY